MMKNINRKFGFTLAEALIALGIVGIIASITVPQLINNYNEKGFEALEEKAKANLSQALDLYLTDLGKDHFGTSVFNTNAKIQTFQEKYLRGTVCSTSSDCIDTGYLYNPLFYKCIKTKDGIVTCMSRLYSKLTGDDSDCWNQYSCGAVTFDLNGTAGPNIEGKDILKYHYTSQAKVLKD